MHPHTQKLLTGLTLGAALSVGGYFWVGRGPDFQVHFERQVVSQVPPQSLAKSVDHIINWADWHFNTRQVQATDATGMVYSAKDQTLMRGSLLRFSMEPPKKEWKRFFIQALVTDYEPGRLFTVRLVEETKGRISQLFSNLQWTVEFLPSKDGRTTLIYGRASALTLSRRARFFSRIAPRVVMNQVFYPDLERLARIEFPKDRLPPE
jgi:hypothetical protein